MLLPALANDEQIVNTPSKLDNISTELEYALRIRGCLLINKAGILNDLPQSTITTAQVLFHRFWYISSMKNFSIKVECTHTFIIRNDMYI